MSESRMAACEASEDGYHDVRRGVCVQCGLEVAEDERDEAYERAAARARNNDFEDTDGRDWT